MEGESGRVYGEEITGNTGHHKETGEVLAPFYLQ